VALPVRVVVAQSEQQIEDAERVRWQVYCAEECLLPPTTGRDKREIDDNDFSPLTAHVLAYVGDEPVGTVRLITAPRPSRHAKEHCGLPIESKFVLSGFERPGVVLAEVTRYCVLRKFRGTRVTPALFAALHAESKRRGISHWVAGANAATDSSEDAAIAYQLIVARKLLSHVFQARCLDPAGPAGPAGDAQRWLYTPEQRSSAARGELDALKLPHTLQLFAAKMAARYLGPPAFDTGFKVFAVPLVTRIADLEERCIGIATATAVAAPAARAASTP
jgi:hypothetical protein